MITKNIGVTYEAGEFKQDPVEQGDVAVIIGKTNNESTSTHKTDGTEILKYDSYDKAQLPIKDGGIATYDPAQSDVKITIFDEDRIIYKSATVKLKKEGKEDTTLTMEEGSDFYHGKVEVGTYTLEISGSDITTKIEENFSAEKLYVEADYVIDRKANVTFMIKAKPFIPTVNVTVNDGTNPIVGAMVSIGDETQITDGEGNVSFKIAKGTYNLSVLAVGKKMVRESLEITTDMDKTVSVTTAGDTYIANIVVKDNTTDAPISEAKVKIKDVANLVTGSDGKTTINLLNSGKYSLNVSATEYTAVEDQELTIESEAANLEVKLTKLTKAQLRKLESLKENEEIPPATNARIDLGGTPVNHQETEGTYTIEGNLPYNHGEVTISIEVEGYDPFTKELDIKGGTYTQEFIFKEEDVEVKDPTITPNTKENCIVNQEKYNEEGEAKPILRKNPVLEHLEVLFKANDTKLATSEDRPFPYLYVIDLGAADNQNNWLTAFDKSKSLIECYWEVYVGSEALGKNNIPTLMKKASENIIAYEENLLLREGICVLYDDLTHNEFRDICKNNKINHITFVEEGKLGASNVARIITTPFYLEPGYLKVKNITEEEVKLRSLSEIQELYFAGATFIRMEKEDNRKFARINLAITSEWNNIDFPARSELKNVRIANALLREIFNDVNKYIKRNETEMYIAMIQALVNAKIERFVQNSWVRPYDSVSNPNGTSLNAGINDSEEGGILISGNIMPIHTMKTIKVYSTITK